LGRKAAIVIVPANVIGTFGVDRVITGLVKSPGIVKAEIRAEQAVERADRLEKNVCA
jgi:hypothetical protein